MEGAGRFLQAREPVKQFDRLSCPIDMKLDLFLSSRSLDLLINLHQAKKARPDDQRLDVPLEDVFKVRQDQTMPLPPPPRSLNSIRKDDQIGSKRAAVGFQPPEFVMFNHFLSTNVSAARAFILCPSKPFSAF